MAGEGKKRLSDIFLGIFPCGDKPPVGVELSSTTEGGGKGGFLFFISFLFQLPFGRLQYHW